MYDAGNNPFSACKLPNILKRYYDDLEQYLKDREKENDASAKSEHLKSPKSRKE
jgi:hypothetical protein